MRSIFEDSPRTLRVLFLLALLAAPASAGVHEGNGEIGFDLGWVDIGGGDYRDDGRFSFRGGYHFTDWFQLEGQLLAIGTDGPHGIDAIGGVFANAVFNWHASETVVPYGLVGLGAVEMSSFPFGRCHSGPGRPGRPGRPCFGRDGHYHHYDDDESSLGVQLALGSRFFFGRGRTALRLEGSVLGFEDDFGQDREVLSLSVGLTWRLGKSRRPAAGGTD